MGPVARVGMAARELAEAAAGAIATAGAGQGLDGDGLALESERTVGKTTAVLPGERQAALPLVGQESGASATDQLDLARLAGGGW